MVDSRALGQVVVAEPFDERGLAVLRAAGAEVVSVVGEPRSKLHAALGSARGLIVRSETHVDASLLAFAPQLRVVARAGVGVDAIDVDAASKAGIVVVNTPAANTIAATEHTFALLFAAMRGISLAHESVRAGLWKRAPYVGRELHRKTLGVIGLGRIGSNVASRAAAFGMTVVAYDPYVPAARAGALGVELLTFEEVLSRSDVVTLHVPLTPATRAMIDARALSLMPAHATLVNCARGGVVDALALLEALDSGSLRCAAIDVVPEEPPPQNSASARLLRHERVVATPHLGGSTFEALERIALELAHDVVRVLDGRPASGAVNAPMLSGADAERASGFIDLAFRLGTLLPQLFDAPVRDEIAVALCGDLESIDGDPFLAAMLAGLLPFLTDRRATIVNALDIARDLGIPTSIVRERAAVPFRSSLVVAAGGRRIAGTVLAPGARIVEIDGFEMDAVADGAMLVTRHDDVPGMVGRIGTILGNAAVNISTMQVARSVRGGQAMMVLGIDRDLDRAVVESIASVGGIADVRLVRL